MTKKSYPYLITGILFVLSISFLNFRKTTKESNQNSINTSGVRLENRCQGHPDNRQIMWGNFVIELGKGNFKSVSKNAGYCIKRGLEPQIYKINGRCNSAGYVVFNNEEIETNCREFEPIEFNCKIYSEDYDFKIQQTNLSHFTKNINGELHRIRFEKTGSTRNKKGEILVGTKKLKRRIRNNKLKKQIPIEILRNPLAMGYASCIYFSSELGAGQHRPRFSDNDCLWNNPSAPGCYGKYQLDLFDKKFYHPSYHGKSRRRDPRISRGAKVP